MIKKKLNINEVKKYLQRKGLIIRKNKKISPPNNGWEVISKITISSVGIMLFFFMMPSVIHFKNERILFSKEFKNNSKSTFKKTFENKELSKLKKLDEDVIEKYLFEDVFEFNDLPNDAVRLSASTIEQLFKDTNYSLDDVRKKKLVKPVSLSLLPAEIKMIENTKKRKEFFIQIILPLVIEENNSIRSDRKKLFKILKKRNKKK